jgi:hypothetical protein
MDGWGENGQGGALQVSVPRTRCHCEERSDVAIRSLSEPARRDADCHTILRMVRNDIEIWKSLLFQGLPVPSSVRFAATFPPREGILPR